MASDEEFRKVAEDMRALARSLARELWDATQSARGSGHPPTEALRRGVRDAVHGARQEFRHELRRRQRGWRGGPTDPAWRDIPPGPPWRRTPPGWSGWGAPPGASGPARRTAPPYSHERRRTADARPPVRRRWDASVLLTLMIVVFGAAWLVSASGVVHLSAEAVLAVGLMLLGAGLIVTARTDWSLSRHAWPVLLGAVLVVGLFATSTSFGVAGALSHLSFGSSRTTAAPAGGTVYGGFGQLTVDASRVHPGAVIRVEGVAGNTYVQLGPGQSATVDARVLAGRICIDGRDRASGVGAISGPVAVPSAGSPTVTIDIRQLAGSIEVGRKGCRAA